MQALGYDPADRYHLGALKRNVVREGGIANAAVMHPTTLHRLIHATSCLLVFENKYTGCDVILDGLRLLGDDRCPLDYVWVGDSAELENLEIP